MDINKRRPVRITAEIMDRYESEPERRVFSEEITKNEIPDTEYKEISYNILRRDVDYLGHMHNIIILMRHMRLCQKNTLMVHNLTI